MHIVLGIVLLVVGVLLIAYSGQISHAFGRREWADRHLGGTTQGFVLIGVVVIIVSTVIIFGGGKGMSTDVKGVQLQPKVMK